MTWLFISKPKLYVCSKCTYVQFLPGRASAFRKSLEGAFLEAWYRHVVVTFEKLVPHRPTLRDLIYCPTPWMLLWVIGCILMWIGWVCVKLSLVTVGYNLKIHTIWFENIPPWKRSYTHANFIDIFFSIFAEFLHWCCEIIYFREERISLLFQFCYMLLLCWLAWLLITQFHPPELFSLWSETKFDKKFGIFFLCCAKINIQLQITITIHSKYILKLLNLLFLDIAARKY